MGFSLGPFLKEECRPQNPTHNSGTCEETLQSEVMSAARNRPLLCHLDALQTQPMQHCMSHHAMLDPNDIVPSQFDFDEPNTATPDPEPPSLRCSLFPK